MSLHLHQAIEDSIAYEAARKSPPKNFPALPEIPGGRYTSRDFHDAEFEQVWRRSWVCVGRDEGLREPGSYRTFDRLGAPMLLVRGKDGKLRAFYNTCRHRGAPVVRQAEGKSPLLRCQYHSWTYGLDGTLKAVPDERDFPCLDKSRRGLVEVRCDSWAGWVFVSDDPQVMPLMDYLGSIPDELACVAMETLRTVQHKTYSIACNWKAAVDAFLEVYHINTIHPTNAAIMLDHKAASMGLMPHGHSRMVTRKKLNQGVNFAEFEGAPDISSIADIYRKNNVAYSIFPNVIVPVDSVGFPFLLFWPEGPDRCVMEAIYVAPDWDGERPAFWDRYLPIFDLVLDEDLQNLAPIQASLKSKAFSGMMINYQERRIYWMHEEVDRRIGADRIPAGLAVEQLLSAHIEQPLPIAAE